MVVPSGYLGDFLLTNWTDAILFFPETQELPATSQVVRHFDIETMLEVCLPLWVKGISCTFLS